MFNQGPATKSTSSKEGLSIYGLFRRFAYTPQGRALLRRNFLRPSVNLDVIRGRHDLIAMFLQPGNGAALDRMIKGMKYIKNLRPVLINIRKGVSMGSAKVTGFKATVWAVLLAVC